MLSFNQNLFLLQAYKIEVSRRSLHAILVDAVGFTKMTSYSLLLYLLQVTTGLVTCFLSTRDTLGWVMSLIAKTLLLIGSLQQSFFYLDSVLNPYLMWSISSECRPRLYIWLLLHQMFFAGRIFTASLLVMSIWPIHSVELSSNWYNRLMWLPSAWTKPRISSILKEWFAVF